MAGVGTISVIAIVLTVCLLPFGFGESGTGKAEKVCEKPKQFAYELDFDWVMAQKKWYFPMMNKQDLLRQSSDILGQTLDTVEKDLELSSKACIQASWDGLSAIIRGFNGKRTSYNLSPMDWLNFNILGFEKAWDGGQTGTLYLTDSDNKRFVFFVRCWEDGERTWSVMTTKKKVSDKLKAKILAHVKLLGFPEDDVVELDFEKCSPEKKTEL